MRAWPWSARSVAAAAVGMAACGQEVIVQVWPHAATAAAAPVEVGRSDGHWSRGRVELSAIKTPRRF